MTRLRRPINQRGPHVRRWGAWQDSNRRIVQRRALGRCEGCGQSGLVLEWAHLLGRSVRVAEPWASLDCLTAALCVRVGEDGPGCHRKVDLHIDPELADRLRWEAVERLCGRFEASLTDAFGTACEQRVQAIFEDPADAVCHLIDELESAGWRWDELASEIVRDEAAA